MDGKLDSSKRTISNYKSFGWSTYGTARSNFGESLDNDSLKQQLSIPILPKSIKNLKLQFSEIQIGSELFFQAIQHIENKDGFIEASKDKLGNSIKFFNLGSENKWQNLLSKQIIENIETSFKVEMTELKYL